MGTRGPAPRREAEVRRTNHKGTAEQVGHDDLQALPYDVDLAPEPPAAPDWWDPLIKRWWDALQRDPARKWMTSADWAAAEFHFESMSRDLKPQVVGVSEAGEPVMARVPVKGANLAAYQKFLAAIGMLEANRLRMSKEVTLFPAAPVETEGDNVTSIQSRRREGVV